MAPRIATKEVVAISNILATDINSKAFNKKATIVVKNGWSDSSACFLSKCVYGKAYYPKPND